MRKVTYSLSMSLDGYITGPDGSFEWATPSLDVFRLATDEVRGLDVHLLGRRLYETMRYWDTVEPASLDDDEREFAGIWNALRKIVFSHSLREVEGSYELSDGSFVDELELLASEPGKGEIALGGADLAASAAAAGLIDEYRIRTYPVLLGGGTPFFAHDRRRHELELLETRAFDDGVTYTRYAVMR